MHMNVLYDLLSTDIREQKPANYHSDLVEETFKILRAISYEQYNKNNYFEFKALASKPNPVVVKIWILFYRTR